MHADHLRPLLEAAYVEQGHPFYRVGAYNLNIFGIRSSRLSRDEVRFDDVIGVAYRDHHDTNRLQLYRGTVDPGTPYLLDPMNPRGTAAWAVGHNPSCWMLGLHHGKTPALVQCGPIKIHRDNDRDNIFEAMPTNEEIATNAGLNLHYMGDGPDSRAVNRWSAGCWGCEDPRDLDALLELCRLQKKTNPKWYRFSGTLFDYAAELEPFFAALNIR
jgi:hypothetical protein